MNINLKDFEIQILLDYYQERIDEKYAWCMGLTAFDLKESKYQEDIAEMQERVAEIKQYLTKSP